MYFSLSARERALETLVAVTKDVRQLKRSQALLAVSAGEAVAEVARQMQVARNTIYSWIARFRERPGVIAERLIDTDRPGRPGRPDYLIQSHYAALPPLLAKKPTDFGNRHAEWTTPLLQVHLNSQSIDASVSTFRHAGCPSGDDPITDRFGESSNGIVEIRKVSLESPGVMSFSQAVLAKTSRKFAMTIALLPEPTRTDVSLAYRDFCLADPQTKGVGFRLIDYNRVSRNRARRAQLSGLG